MTLDLPVISGYDTKAKATKANIDKWDCIKLQNFCASKVTNKTVKRFFSTHRIVKIFANHISDKQLIFRIKNYKSIKPKYINNKNDKGLDRHFS